MKKKSEPVVVDQEEEKVISFKRVIIASTICIVMMAGLIWGITWVSEVIVAAGSDILGAQVSSTPDRVRLPQKEDAETIISQIQNYANSISFESITSSQSAVHTIVQTLHWMQGSDFGIEEFICSAMCK